MLRHCRTTRGQQIVINTAKVVFMTQPFTLASPPLSQCVLFPRSSNLRQLSDTGGSSETMNSDYNSQLEKIFEEKRSLRSKLRAELKKMDPIRRTQEGLGFDKSGRRLGRSGGYYDMFLKKYQELVKKQNWKQPFLVALSYSLQIVDDGILAVTPYDVPVDALVTPSGFIPISSIALENCQ